MIKNLTTYGALCAKTRALYGKRLRLADYDRMAALNSEAEVLDCLRQYPGWTKTVAQLSGGHSGDYIGRVELEAALWEELWTEYLALDYFVPLQDKLIMQFPILLMEQRAILTALRRIKAGQAKVARIPAKALSRSPLDTKALEICTGYDTLLSACRETLYYKPLLFLRPQEGNPLPDYNATECLLRSTYFSHMYRIIHQNYAGDTQKILLRSYGEQIDLLNIIHILRLKTYFPGVEDFLSVLFPFNFRLRPELVRALCAAPDVAGVFDLLRTSPYAKSFLEVNVTEVEDYYRRAFYTFNKRQLVGGAASIYTAMAYLNLKELELKMLVNVIESVKYQVPYDATFARLIGD